MVFTLHRYIFRDLLKVFCLTALVLCVVLSLGMMLQPLRHFGVDPSRVPRLIMYVLPITLTMVIPIAALLASTLVYGRMAALNEINACRSSGVSLQTTIYPALALALLVGMVTLLLDCHVIPAFSHKFEAIIKADAESMIYHNIEKNGNLGKHFGSLQVFADDTDPKNHRLIGVVVVRASKDGSVDEIMTAEQVLIEFRKGKDSEKILLHLINAKSVRKGFSVNLGDTTVALELPRLLPDELKFKTLDQLKAIQENMTLFSPIRRRLREVQKQLTVERFADWCQQRLSKNGFLQLRYQNRHILKLYARSCSLKVPRKGRVYGGTIYIKTRSPAVTDHITGHRVAGHIATNAANVPARTKANATINVDYYIHNTDINPERTYHAQKARFYVNTTMDLPQLRLELEKVQWYYFNDKHPISLLSYDFPNIALPSYATRIFSLDYLLNKPVPLKEINPSKKLVKLYKKLKGDCQQLSAEIRAQKHTRLAFGASCIVLVLLGSALGIMFRSGNLLTAFGISFIPAALCLITILTGKHIAEQELVTQNGGIIFLWSGVLITAAVDAVLYYFLMKR